MELDWLPLPDFEHHYSISSCGKVKRNSTGRILKLKINIDGYHVVCLSVNNIKKEIRVARKVAEAFMRKPSEIEVVNHKDCNKLNDSVTNLEWTTISGNTKHAYDNGLIVPWLKGVTGSDHPFSREYIITTPDNTVVYVKGLNQFARDHNLTVRELYKVLSGAKDNYKGYKVRRLF